MKTLKDYLEILDDDFAGWSREELIRLCQKNDPNGVWSDEDSIAEGHEPITRNEIINIIKQNMEENDYTSFREWRRAASGLASSEEDEYKQIRDVLKNAKSSGPEFGLFDRYKD